MADEVELVRSRVDLVELISEKIALKRSGKNWKGLCPFHQDKNPSFHVNPTLGRYKCFSCGAGGDCFTWVMETERVEFPEALRELAKRAGVELSALRTDPATVSKREVYERIMASAQSFFRTELSRNNSAEEYCERRGITKPTRDKWELGYAPEGGDSLAAFLKKEGFRLADCRELFLVDEDAGGGYYDRFRGRLMFPIRDERGKLVAFGGRLVGEASAAKYINSSDTPLYSKRRVLYGMHEARDAMSRTRQAVLVEGYLDVIACHRSGLDNAVASLGTSLADDHAKLLSRWADEVLVLYDNDEAGLNAAERAIPILEAEGLRVKVSLIDHGKDPDALLQAEGTDAVRALAKGGVTPTEFRLSQIARKFDVTDEDYWNGVVEALALCANDLEVTRHLLPLASRYPALRDPEAAQKALRRLVAKARAKFRSKPTSDRRIEPSDSELVPNRKASPVKLSDLHSAERALFSGLFSIRLSYAAWRGCFDESNFLTGAGVRLASAVVEAFPDAPPDSETLDWIYDLPEDGTRELFSELAFLTESTHLIAEFDDALALLRSKKEARAVVRIRMEGEFGDETLASIHEKLRLLRQGDSWDD